jgi:hypothetical protein
MFWILTYILTISKGFKDKSYGMPLLALCANISLEFVYSFVEPHPPPQIYINYLWFGLDTIIVFQFFKYYKNEFSNLSSSEIGIVFGLLIFTALGIILSGALIFGDSSGVFSAFGQNLLMSILFIVMFFNRGKSLRGQSIFIVISKMIGTGLTSLYFYLFNPVTHSSVILPFLFVSIFIFDFIYAILVYDRYKKNHMSMVKV